GSTHLTDHVPNLFRLTEVGHKRLCAEALCGQLLGSCGYTLGIPSDKASEKPLEPNCSATAVEMPGPKPPIMIVFLFPLVRDEFISSSLSLCAEHLTRRVL